MSEGRLAKPQLRNLHIAQVKKGLIGAIALSLVVTFSLKFLVTDAQERKIENFYKTYDPAKALEVMNNAGLMQSCPK
ncbi:cytochrome c oxidase subunit cyclope [Andrena cerasifolii]|uniref:cytochrome c oxidase subunit cyclope n=1 Tax=Andrena cerasifolii TaxID=2819439 RepID=UPI00403780C0